MSPTPLNPSLALNNARCSVRTVLAPKASTMLIASQHLSLPLHNSHYPSLTLIVPQQQLLPVTNPHYIRHILDCQRSNKGVESIQEAAEGERGRTGARTGNCEMEARGSPPSPQRCPPSEAFVLDKEQRMWRPRDAVDGCDLYWTGPAM